MFIVKYSILKIKIKWIIKFNKVINNLNYSHEDYEGLQWLEFMILKYYNFALNNE